MRYFNECKTIDEVKALYKKLAKENHPDTGGDTATMQAINVEYSFACASITKDNNLSNEESDNEMKLSEEYRNVIMQIIRLPNIMIETVGHWIWVTGNTYAVRKELKTAGLFFASKKAAWYFRSELYKTKGSGKSLDEIKAKYGSETISHTEGAKTLKN